MRKVPRFLFFIFLFFWSPSFLTASCRDLKKSIFSHIRPCSLPAISHDEGHFNCFLIIQISFFTVCVSGKEALMKWRIDFASSARRLVLKLKESFSLTCATV